MCLRFPNTPPRSQSARAWNPKFSSTSPQTSLPFKFPVGILRERYITCFSTFQFRIENQEFQVGVQNIPSVTNKRVGEAPCDSQTNLPDKAAPVRPPDTRVGSLEFASRRFWYRLEQNLGGPGELSGLTVRPDAGRRVGWGKPSPARAMGNPCSPRAAHAQEEGRKHDPRGQLVLPNQVSPSTCPRAERGRTSN